MYKMGEKSMCKNYRGISFTSLVEEVEVVQQNSESRNLSTHFVGLKKVYHRVPLKKLFDSMIKIGLSR